MDDESFEAYATEVASVNIGRLNMMLRKYRGKDLKTDLEDLRRSLEDLRTAAKTGEYPATI